MRFGAKSIGKNYDNGKVESLTFQLPINGKDVLVQLPAKPKLVHAAMQKKKLYPVSWGFEKTMAQAERTAWKIQQDWLEIELTNLTLNQKEPLEIFLPYIWDGRDTVYQRIKNGGYRALLPETTE